MPPSCLHCAYVPCGSNWAASWCTAKTKVCDFLFSVLKAAQTCHWRLWGRSRRLQRWRNGSSRWTTVAHFSSNTTATLASLLTVPRTWGRITTRSCFCLWVSSKIMTVREVDKWKWFAVCFLFLFNIFLIICTVREADNLFFCHF